MHVCSYVCACVLIHMSQVTCEDQRKTCGSQFFLPIMWVPGMKLRSRGLAASAFIPSASLWNRKEVFEYKMLPILSKATVLA